MKITRNDILKAILSVLTTMLFCGCLCYVTMRYFTTYDGDTVYLTHGMLCFAFLFIEIVLCSFYTARNIRVILIKSQWRNTKKWPRGYSSEVAFIQKIHLSIRLFIIQLPVYASYRIPEIFYKIAI